MTRKWDPELEQYRESGEFAGNDGATAAGGMGALQPAIGGGTLIQDDYEHGPEQLLKDTQFADELRDLGFDYDFVVPAGERTRHEDGPDHAVIIMRVGDRDMTLVREGRGDGARYTMFVKPRTGIVFTRDGGFKAQAVQAGGHDDEMPLDSYELEGDDDIGLILRQEIGRYDRIDAFATAASVDPEGIFDATGRTFADESWVQIEASLDPGPGEYDFRAKNNGELEVKYEGLSLMDDGDEVLATLGFETREDAHATLTNIAAQLHTMRT